MPAPPTYSELWRAIVTVWSRRTSGLSPTERHDDPFHTAFMGLSAQHIEAWEVIDRAGRAPQALIDDLEHFIRTWITPAAAAWEPSSSSPPLYSLRSRSPGD